MTLDEAADMSGETKSRSSLQLLSIQEELLKKNHKTGKPIVLLINAGRTKNSIGPKISGKVSN